MLKFPLILIQMNKSKWISKCNLQHKSVLAVPTNVYELPVIHSLQCTNSKGEKKTEVTALPITFSSCTVTDIICYHGSLLHGSMLWLRVWLNIIAPQVQGKGFRWNTACRTSYGRNYFAHKHFYVFLRCPWISKDKGTLSPLKKNKLLTILSLIIVKANLQ